MLSYSGGDYMIKSNLKVLLAQNNIKLSKVSVDTGISRTTLTALSEGHSKGVQFDTLNTLCNYFNINPSSFFSYFPLDIDLVITNIDLRVSDYESDYVSNSRDYIYNAIMDSVEVYAIVKKYNKQEYNIELTGNGIISGVGEFIEINLELDSNDKNYDKFKSEFSLLSPDLEKYFYKITEESLFSQLSKYLDDRLSSIFTTNMLTLNISNISNTPF